MTSYIAQGKWELVAGGPLGKIVEPKTGELFQPIYEGRFYIRATEPKRLRAFAMDLTTPEGEPDALLAWLRQMLRAAATSTFETMLASSTGVRDLIASDYRAGAQEMIPSHVNPTLTRVGAELLAVLEIKFEVDAGDEQTTRDRSK